MKLDPVALLAGICDESKLGRAQRLAGELTRLFEDQKAEVTPLILARLEEFLMLYHIVQGIEDGVRQAGLRGQAIELNVFHADIERAMKFRDRLNKSIKDIEAVLSANGANGPVTLAELLSPLEKEYPSVEAWDKAV